MKTFKNFNQPILFTLFMALSFLSYAAYFKNMPYSVSQPNGQTIACFVSGDEFFNWLHDANDYTIIQSSDGYYYYATYDMDNNVSPSVYMVNTVEPASVGLIKNVKISEKDYKQRVAEYYKNEDKSVKAPHSGTLNNLAVYIRFSDDTEFSTLRQIYDNRLNSNTTKSLKSYYTEVSYSALTINTTHYPICPLTSSLSYQDSHPRAYYQPYNATTNPIGYTEANRTQREHTLLVSAINYIAASVPAGLNIDGDNDGNVDNVCFIIKGGSGAWAVLLWAHRWSLYSQTVLINGKRVLDYTFQPESQVNVQTLCHEMFHALGAPDLYHYSYDGFIPAGNWDLMESGFGHMGAFMKYKYSDHTWITNIPEITTSGTYTLNPLSSSTNNCFKIYSPNSTSEYFILEYRKKEGILESSIPGSGLLIYRINTAAGNGNANGPPDEVYIYRPYGTPTINGSINSAAFNKTINKTTFNNLSNPNCFFSDGSMANLDIYDIDSTSSTISFKVGFNEITHPNFYTSKTTIKELEKINFNNLSSGNATSCLWNFGNGQTSTEYHPQNINYNEAGEYTVSLISYNTFGSDTIIKENYIKVNPSQLNCTDAVNITPGVPYNGNSAVSGHSNVNKYNCSSWNENGAEVVHSITTSSIGNITATLSNLSSNFNVYLLPSCKENSCLVSGDVSLTYNNAPIGTYYIVVDGTSNGTYTLAINYPYNGIDEFFITKSFVISPNPNNGIFTLKFNDNNKQNKDYIKIYSSLGNLVLNEKLSESNMEKHLNLTSLPEGIYFIQLILRDGIKYIDKFIIKK